ncbi:PREDICTED: monocyte differentiation antigen CD14-like [Elephantulus edwardii]|uniref:monocyte differentiation antigen CD14-like n=1 Tax=Elephantulus edwardii TaxID=28737 RepID=UPI0003F0663E|nr:PREDICTED: monocyte differentiation antigen CD14-like [Elephantulus edwardii]
MVSKVLQGRFGDARGSARVDTSLYHVSPQDLSPYLLLLLLLPSLLCTSEVTPEPCELDDKDYLCSCNFSDPEPDWSSGFQCMVAYKVEIRAGGRNLEKFLKHADTSPRQYSDVVKGLRVRELTVGAARVPARLLFALLRALGHSRLRELTLEDLEITGTLPPALEAAGPALSTLRLRNVSWAAGGAWLAELQQWLRPNLKELGIVQAQPLAFSCEQLRSFPSLATLDLSDNPGLGEGGLAATLCGHKFPALQDLRLRNAGMETLSVVCETLVAAVVQPHHLDLSQNALRASAHLGAPGCVWPSTLKSLNFSFAGLEQVPKGLPAKLRVLDLSCNRLSRAPRPDELPEVEKLILDGNPFMDPESPKPYGDSMNSSVARTCVYWLLATGLSGSLVLFLGNWNFV